MYLSRLQLNINNRQVWRHIIGNPYKVHQMVMRGFPDGAKRETAQVLHRLEIRDHAAILIVQSTIEPNWDTINPNYLSPADPFDILPNPAVKPLRLPLQTGQVLSFRLCANPTVKKIRRDDSGKFRNSNRVPLIREDKQLQWLAKHAEASGFRPFNVTITQSQKQKAWKNGNKHSLTIYAVQFDGRLKVIAPDKLQQAVTAGIGPSKAFGCGLLSLAPG